MDKIKYKAFRWTTTAVAGFLLLASGAKAADCPDPSACAASPSVVSQPTVSDLQIQLSKISQNVDALAARLDAAYRTLGSMEAASVADLKRTIAEQQAQITQLTAAVANAQSNANSAQSSANAAQSTANSAASAAAKAQSTADDALSRVAGFHFHYTADGPRISINVDDYPGTVPIIWLNTANMWWWTPHGNLGYANISSP